MSDTDQKTNDTNESLKIKGIDKGILQPGKLIFNELKNTVYSSFSFEYLMQSRNVSNTVRVQLDESFAKVDYVPGLKTTLYPHQKTAVHCLLEFENTRKFSIALNAYDNQKININYNANVLSEPVGSGKTIDILSLILLSPLPRTLPGVIALKTAGTKTSVGFVRCRYKRLLTPTIIFVGSSVMKQWENAIRTFTDLRSFSVNSVKELRVLFQMMETNSLNRNYDIVLVKNGKITVPITLPNGIELHEKNRISQAYIYNLLDNCNIYCWARAVIDDFDTIGLPHNAGVVPAIYTIYVSSTRKSMGNKRTYIKNTQLASECLRKYSFGCNNIMYNQFLFNVLNVRNRTSFIQSATQLPRPKYHVCLFENPHNRYMSLMNSMGDNEVNRITEMLNGDAIGEAAEAAGVASSSVADIFSTLLGSKFEDYRTSGDLLEFIEYEQSEERVDNRLPMAEHEDPDTRYGKTELLEFQEIEYKYPGVNTLLKDNHEAYTELKEKSGHAIERVKSNISHGLCPVCRMDLSESEDAVIVKCCSAVFCGVCGFKAQGLGDRYNKLCNGHCANCRSRVSIKDLIYIGKDGFALDDILEENFDEEEAEDEEIGIGIEDPLEKQDRTKYTGIIDVIKGNQVREDKRVDLHIPNMMKGDKSLPEPEIRKVLIFANFEETLSKIIEKLDKNNIKYWKLHGGVNEIDRLANAFTDCKETCALVINSTTHCSGLNLQTATDLIFAHRMNSQAIESQVAGRGHRLGRMSPLNIWYFLYDNEYDELKRTHNVREMSKEEIIHEKNLEDGTEQSTLNVVDNTDSTVGIPVSAQRDSSGSDSDSDSGSDSD